MHWQNFVVRFSDWKFPPKQNDSSGKFDTEKRYGRYTFVTAT